jgi:hypothetical protein
MTTKVKITSVVNVKVANIRPKYDNLQEWCQDCNNIYIGRRGVVFVDDARFPYESSIWANPFKISKDMSREDCITQYEIYIRNKIKQESLGFELLKLKGKNLGCWCKPSGCHGDILLKLIDEFNKK